jgi:diketogulonate reductase-like aldo/keto reductase
MFMHRSFWTLTGSPSLLQHATLQRFAQKKGISPAQAIYRLAQVNGVTPLSGTTNEQHMKEDVSVENIEVSSEDRKDLDAVVLWMGLQST